MSLKNEITMMRGRIVETKRQLAEDELLAQADLVNLRTILDPFEPDITKINTASAVVISNRLNDKVQEIIIARTQLAKFESEIGQ